MIGKTKYLFDEVIGNMSLVISESPQVEPCSEVMRVMNLY